MYIYSKDETTRAAKICCFAKRGLSVHIHLIWMRLFFCTTSTTRVIKQQQKQQQQQQRKILKKLFFFRLTCLCASQRIHKSNNKRLQRSLVLYITKPRSCEQEVRKGEWQTDDWVSSRNAETTTKSKKIYELKRCRSLSCLLLLPWCVSENGSDCVCMGVYVCVCVFIYTGGFIGYNFCCFVLCYVRCQLLS